MKVVWGVLRGAGISYRVALVGMVKGERGLWHPFRPRLGQIPSFDGMTEPVGRLVAHLQALKREVDAVELKSSTRPWAVIPALGRDPSKSPSRASFGAVFGACLIMCIRSVASAFPGTMDLGQVRL